jgi:MFS family permease
MGLGVLLWSLAQMVSPYAAAAGLPQLLACRFAMGMSESVTIPTIQVCISTSCSLFNLYWAADNCSRQRTASCVVSTNSGVVLSKYVARIAVQRRLCNTIVAA